MHTHTSTAADVLVSRALVAGVIGGLAGAWAMTQFHVALYGGGATGLREPQSHRVVDGGHDPTSKAADQAAALVGNTPLTAAEQQVAAPAVHYAFGASMGAVYGAAAGMWPGASRGAGLPFGAAVWLVADEAALPALGLARGPRAYPLATHLEMLAAHLVFGCTTHMTMRAVLRLWSTEGGGTQPLESSMHWS